MRRFVFQGDRCWQILWACARKDLKSALTERSTLLQTITLPVNYLILLSLFVLSGSNAPTAVVLQEDGPYAQAFVQAMQQAHSFHVMLESANEAAQQYQAGTLVALVTIPANFDTQVAAGRPVQVQAQINNLNEDLTDDVRRALGLTVTSFYARVFPYRVPITPVEIDAYSSDTGYLPYLSISILVIALLITGLLFAGMASAKEWEKATVKAWLLAPAPHALILLGKLLATFLIGLPGLLAVLTLVVVVAGWPANFPLVVEIGLLSLLVFAAAGMALGIALKDRATLTTIARAIAVPLLFLSGLFAPISFNTQAIQVLARLFPVHYAIVLQQFAFKAFVSNTLPPSLNVAILAGYGLVFLLLASLAVRVSRLAH